MKTRSGDNLGHTNLTGGYRPPHHLGILVEAGDRVRLRRDLEWVPGATRGSSGTVLQSRGWGRVKVRLDSGLELNAPVNLLDFLKMKGGHIE